MFMMYPQSLCYLRVVHHSFTRDKPVRYSMHYKISAFVQNRRDTVVCVYHPVSVLKINHKNHAKTLFFAHFIVHYFKCKIIRAKTC